MDNLKPAYTDKIDASFVEGWPLESPSQGNHLSVTPVPERRLWRA